MTRGPRSRPSPYLRLQVGGFTCTVQERPSGRRIKQIVAALLPLFTLTATAVSLLLR